MSHEAWSKSDEWVRKILSGGRRLKPVKDVQKTGLPDQPPAPLGCLAAELLALADKALADKVSKMEHKADELDCVRTTLLLNFGDTKHNKHGFRIEDKGSTVSLLVEVLEHLTKGK